MFWAGLMLGVVIATCILLALVFVVWLRQWLQYMGF